MKSLSEIGKIALGSRLRLLTAEVTKDASKIYGLYNVELSPKWFPVFFVLSENEEKTISEIANEIRHSQPSVSKIIREMTRAGLVEENRKAKDKRKNPVALSSKGKLIVEKIQLQYQDVDSAIENMINESAHNLWEAIEEWEFLLDQKSLYRRVLEQKKRRESLEIEIVQYRPEHQEIFKFLNVDWISTYFEMEEADYRALDHPKKYILDKGGKILVALYKNEAVGVCALIKMDDPNYDFELAKMAVSTIVRGRNIGWILGQKAIETAKELGASKLYLESNTILTPAINLYHKLGFQKITGRTTPYKRCNIQMELNLEM